MSFRVLPFLCISILWLNTVTAQCPTTVTTATTESRCKESGTITVTATPAAAYTYEIIAGPSLSDPTTSNIFTSLGAGTYTIQISRGGCSTTTTATVAGNYADPGLISVGSVGKIACPGGSTCVTVNQPTGGRLPWSYSIVAGPVIKPAQSGTSFCDLTAGTYSVQALDSCGVVRTTQFTIDVDTGYLFFEQYGYSITHSSCNDIVVCPTMGWHNTSSHTLAKVWYVKPNGDTLKTKGFRQVPIGCDTLVGEAHSYGRWQGIAWDTCGRKYQTFFDYNAPSLYVSGYGLTCSGYQVNFGNMWKYGVKVGYTIRKCSDNSIVYNTVQVPPATTFYSPNYELEFDTCYIFEHYNECGDTVRYMNYSRSNTSVFNINACGGPGCKKRGSGHIQLWQDYNSGVPPVTYTIISGPEGVGSSIVQTAGYSWVVFQNMALGTYTIAGVDNCGRRDTVTVVLDKPLIKSVEVTQVPHCSGGANLHVKITSNYILCDNWHSSGSNLYVTGYNTSSPPLPSPVNIVTTPVSHTKPGTWEGDFNNVLLDSVLISYYAYEGCVDDTMIHINQYHAPTLSNIVGYVCDPSGIGTLNYTVTGGKPPYRFRVKPDISSTWSAWQDSAVFTGMSSGAYDISVEDGCPNGEIRSATFYSWEKSDFSMSALCAEYGSPFTLTINPPVNYASYQWYKDNLFLGSGSSYSIPGFSSSDEGVYSVQQSFKNGGCIGSTAKTIQSCAIIPLLFGELSGNYNGNAVVLKWNTLMDEAGTTFHIERSVDGHTFIAVGTLEGVTYSNAGGSLYGFTDNNPVSSAIYRIRYNTANGKTNYSNSIRLSKNNIADDSITVSPIPFNDSFTMSVKSDSKEKCTISLFNINGNIVYQKTTMLKKGYNKIWCEGDGIAALPAGIYILKATTESYTKGIKVLKY